MSLILYGLLCYARAPSTMSDEQQPQGCVPSTAGEPNKNPNLIEVGPVEPPDYANGVVVESCPSLWISLYLWRRRVYESGADIFPVSQWVSQCNTPLHLRKYTESTAIKRLSPPTSQQPRLVKDIYIGFFPPDFMHSGPTIVDITGELHSTKKK